VLRATLAQRCRRSCEPVHRRHPNPHFVMAITRLARKRPRLKSDIRVIVVTAVIALAQ
jgi:hypothetical protein